MGFPHQDAGGYDIAIVRELLADIVAGLERAIGADSDTRAATPQEPPELADAR